LSDRLLLPFVLLLHLVFPARADIVPVRALSGSADDAALFSPRGISIGYGGLLYVADGGSDRIVVFDTAGAVASTVGFSGSAGGRFLEPTDVAAAEGLHLYVLDAGNERVQLFDRYGQFLDVLLDREAGTIGTPLGLEADSFGRLYVTDAEADRVRVFRSFTGQEEFSFGGFGTEPGRFRGPADASVDRSRRIYVADRGNNRVQVFDPLGGFLRSIGEGEGSARLSGPTGVAVDRKGRVFVADGGNARVVVFDEAGGFAGEIREGVGGKPLVSPRGVAVDDAGLLYVSDPAGGLVHLFRYGAAP